MLDLAMYTVSISNDFAGNYSIYIYRKYHNDCNLVSLLYKHIYHVVSTNGGPCELILQGYVLPIELQFAMDFSP